MHNQWRSCFAQAFGVALCLATGLSAQTAPADLSYLLAGVKEIGAPGAPGNVLVIGPNAFAVVAGKEGERNSTAVVAAARLGKGRVVAFGHDGYLHPEAAADTVKLLANACKWGAGSGSVRVGVYRNPVLVMLLRRQPGIEARELEGKTWAKQLWQYQVLCSDSEAAATEEEQQALRKFIEQGGTWVSGSTGWGWAQTHPGKTLQQDHRGNRIVFAAGLAWGDGMAHKTTANGYATTEAISPLLNASAALELIGDKARSPAAKAGDLSQAAWSITQAARVLPEKDQSFRPRLERLMASAEAVVPTAKKPVRASDALQRVVLTLQVQEAQQWRAGRKAHPAAAVFPGAVPEGARALENVAVEIDTAVPEWHSTGLYAAPGKEVRIEVPENAADKGLRLRIGCHSDKLWNLDRWQRVPEITVHALIKERAASLANAFGGLVYVEVPAKCGLGKITVRISNAVAAPRFVLGKTSLAEWKEKQRGQLAPWAELETSRVILTVPSEVVRGLENPEELMKFWDRVLDADADLAAIPRQRTRPERIVCDEQISAGYMHSGYPIMTWLDVRHDVVDFAKLSTKGSWGHFHELGHNHQCREWTFEGTGEVTENLFSLYVMEKVVGISGGRGHPAVSEASVEKNMRKHLAAGAPYEQWKSEPFTALIMYMQLKDAFGWEAYKKVFAEYRALSAADRPKTDQEERDQWMVRFSKTVGKNLGPFFKAWGVPTSAAAQEAIKNLPKWMPPEMEGKR